MGRQYYYHKTIYHNGLNKSKTIAAMNKRELEYKIELQNKQWAEQYEKKKQVEANKKLAQQKKAERELKAKNDAEAKKYAEQMTFEADKIQNQLENLLSLTLSVEPYNFDKLIDNSAFSVAKPIAPKYSQPNLEPKREDSKYNGKPNLITKLSSKKMAMFVKENDKLFEADHLKWEKDCSRINENNQLLREEYDRELNKWKNAKEQFYENQKQHNEWVIEFKSSVEEGIPEAVSDLAQSILKEISIPIDYFSDYDVEYTEETRCLVVNAILPSLENMPTLKSVSYVKTKQELKEIHYTEPQIKKKYENVIYQMVLIILNSLFNINKSFDLIENIVVNGFVNTIDKTTGNDTTICILSVRENRNSFNELNLSLIDAKLWFRKSKGIAAVSISSVTPIQPVQTISREDNRFIEGYGVIDSIEEDENLAAMDWQDFENLIREIFEAEFSTTGSEVKITQASRDGGVDAIAFDSDPIRGGKIVIQAKRYTNVVGVSAVRDLYGTLINEGAMKGILVTTSYYGNDAYEFAKGKPIQLIDGSGLLALMQNHGKKVRIDLQEAKKILNDKQN